MPFHTCHTTGGGSSHHRRRSDLDRMFDGTISPCEKAYMDLFVRDTGLDKTSITLTNTESEVFDESRNEHIKVQAHTVLYKGDEIWRVEPNSHLLITKDDNDDDNDNAMEHSSKQRYHSTCAMLKDLSQLELTIESTVSPVASDEEVLDEIAAAPTSIWCNTTTAINAISSSYGPGVIFRESRKINVDNLIRAAAEEHQRLIAVPEEREATVVEYCLFRSDNGDPGAHVSDASDDDEKDEKVKPSTKQGNVKKEQEGVVTSTVSMASENSSVYLNQQEDDDLSAQQQEAMNAFKVFNMNLFQMLD